jgi:hypothetical protein
MLIYAKDPHDLYDPQVKTDYSAPPFTTTSLPPLSYSSEIFQFSIIKTAPKLPLLLFFIFKFFIQKFTFI